MASWKLRLPRARTRSEARGAFKTEGASSFLFSLGCRKPPRDWGKTCISCNQKEIEMQTKNELWILTTVDDRQTLGEKAVVSIYRKFSSAKRALLTDLKEVMARRELVDSDIEKDWDAMYVQTHDKLNCWFIESQEV